MNATEHKIQMAIDDTLQQLLVLQSWNLGGSHAERLAILYLLSQEPMDMTTFGRAIGISRAAVTTMIDRMSGLKGGECLAFRTSDPGDRRRMMVGLTPEGKQFVREVIEKGVKPSDQPLSDSKMVCPGCGALQYMQTGKGAHFVCGSIDLKQSSDCLERQFAKND